jgi:hypothetical protein
VKLPRLAAVALLLCGSVCLRAEPWDALRGLRPGDRVRITETSGQEHHGSFVKVSTEAISIAEQKNEVMVERARVRRVKVRSGSRRLRNTMIGAGVGVALGVTIDYTLGTYLRNESGESSAARALTYITPIGIGAGIAAAFPAYRTLYRAP